MVCSRWVVRCHSSQYPSHWMMLASPLRCRECVRYWPRTALGSPVLSLHVSCDDYLSMRPTCEVPPRGAKERVFWGRGATTYHAMCRIEGVRVAMARSPQRCVE